MNEDTKPCFQRTASGSVEPAQLREPFTLATRLSHKAARDDRPHFSLMSPLPCVLWVPLLWLPCSHLRGVSWHPWPWLAYEPALGGDHGPGLQMSTCSYPTSLTCCPTWGPLGVSVHTSFWSHFMSSSSQVLEVDQGRWAGCEVDWVSRTFPPCHVQSPGARCCWCCPSFSGFQVLHLSEHRVLGALECLLDLWFKAFPIPFSLLWSSESLHCFFFFFFLNLAEPILVVTCGI